MKKGSELIFISQIKRDGSGVTKRISKRYKVMMQDEMFHVTCLSMTEKTYIATNFNSFVVMFK